MSYGGNQQRSVAPPGAPTLPTPTATGPGAPGWTSPDFVSEDRPVRRQTHVPWGKLLFFAVLIVGGYFAYQALPLPWKDGEVDTDLYSYQYPNSYDQRDPAIVARGGRRTFTANDTAINDHKGAVFVMAFPAAGLDTKSLVTSVPLIRQYMPAKAQASLQQTTLDGHDALSFTGPQGYSIVTADNGKAFVIVCAGDSSDACEKIKSTFDIK